MLQLEPSLVPGYQLSLVAAGALPAPRLPLVSCCSWSSPCSQATTCLLLQLEPSLVPGYQLSFAAAGVLPAPRLPAVSCCSWSSLSLLAGYQLSFVAAGALPAPRLPAVFCCSWSFPCSQACLAWLASRLAWLPLGFLGFFALFGPLAFRLSHLWLASLPWLPWHPWLLWWPGLFGFSASTVQAYYLCYARLCRATQNSAESEQCRPEMCRAGQGKPGLRSTTPKLRGVSRWHNCSLSCRCCLCCCWRLLLLLQLLPLLPPQPPRLTFDGALR